VGEKDFGHRRDPHTYVRVSNHPDESGDRVKSMFKRVLEWLGLRKRPPDIGVREPRRPVPSASGGTIALDPDDEQ
jgi:hypothetical protein